MLHVIAGIYAPEQGNVAVEGRIASLLGGSLGIDPELTGRENLELRGLYLGLSRAEIRERLEDIIDFTELGPFVDMPFRTYSAGMRARLDFAISTSIETEILLLDEGLGVGDSGFIEKANQRLESLAASAGIVVFASHSEPLLRKLCTRAALMESGHVLTVGDVDEVLRRYQASIEA
jgi:ABC-2 type transport system ATP-binding protein